MMTKKLTGEDVDRVSRSRVLAEVPLDTPLPVSLCRTYALIRCV